MTTTYLPIPPARTACVWIAARAEAEAWRNLLRDAAHMPYKTKAEFIKIGYTVEQLGDGIEKGNSMNRLDKIHNALEMAQCAEHNMGNLASMVPGIENNPMFKIVQMQIKSVIDLLDGVSD